MPKGRTIKLAVAEVKARSPHPKRDQIGYPTGGPGGSAVVTAVKQIKEGLNRDRNGIFVESAPSITPIRS